MTDGVLVLDKPVGPTSFDLVARARRAYATREIGHAGTLDPLASGVMVILVGRFTRLQRLFMDHDKRYRATVAFGTRTSTDDAAGEVVESGSADRLSRDEVKAALARFVGPQTQIPPAHSAIHVDGERAYAKARRGEAVAMPARSVVFHDLRLVSFDPGRAVVDVHCSKGTYIRALARDLGAALGVPAHLGGLVRTASGGFAVETAHAASVLDNPDAARAALTTGRAALGGLSTLEVDDVTTDHLSHGRGAPWAEPFIGTAVAVRGETLVALVEQDGDRLKCVRGLMG